MLFGRANFTCSANGANEGWADRENEGTMNGFLKQVGREMAAQNLLGVQAIGLGLAVGAGLSLSLTGAIGAALGLDASGIAVLLLPQSVSLLWTVWVMGFHHHDWAKAS